MICSIKGKLKKKNENSITIETNGLYYEIVIPKSVFLRLDKNIDEDIQLITYHYLNIDKNKGLPVLIGFLEELEKNFFEKFIGVSGVGPKAAIRAFDRPVSIIAKAIEDGDIEFLKTLAGVGKQKAKHIVAHLQGKVGRFALIKEEETAQYNGKLAKREVLEEAKEILKRLQYNSKEAEDMIKKVLRLKPQIDSVEEFLNEIYRQR